ncbi:MULTISPECIES: ClpX C4-type zinc finger protein [unclassified Streptomyces]|uniref:ClpX C4-type zinc finger protein n=1 Tax=unclassified Streptomyces TaxID=2593676 RepID=UPI00386BCAE5
MLRIRISFNDSRTKAFAPARVSSWAVAPAWSPDPPSHHDRPLHGHPRSEERRLIAGPGVWICSDCVALCGESRLPLNTTHGRQRWASSEKSPSQRNWRRSTAVGASQTSTTTPSPTNL